MSAFDLPFIPETERLPIGALVTFTGGSDAQFKWGSGYADHSQLEVGGVYYVSRLEMHTWHTKVWLGEGDLGPFNSVCFERVEPSAS